MTNLEIPDPVVAALVGAFVAGAFSILSFILIRRKEQVTRENEAAASYLERQIEELYGPLLGLVQSNRAVYEVASLRLKGAHGGLDFRRFDEEE